MIYKDFNEINSLKEYVYYLGLGRCSLDFLILFVCGYISKLWLIKHRRPQQNNVTRNEIT